MHFSMPYRWSAGAQYAFALAVVAGAIAVRWVMTGLLGERVPFLIMFGALLPLVLLVRPGPFLAAAIVGWLGSAYLFLPYQRSFRVASDPDAVFWVYFLSVLAAIAAGSLARWRDAVERESEARYRAVTEQSPDAIIVSADGQAVFANPAAARLFGAASPSEVLGRTPHELIAPEYHAVMEARVRGVTRYGELQDRIEYRARRFDGSLIDVEVTAGPFMWERKRAVLVLMRDVTERKRAQEELRHRASQFETVLREAPIGVFVIDANFRVAQVNPVAMKAFARRTSHEVFGRDFAELLNAVWPDGRGETGERIFRKTLETGESFHMPEFREEGADGVVYFDWRISRITLADGRYGIVCYLIDITDQKRAADALRESEARLQLAQSTAQLGLHDYDVRRNIVDWDARTRELWGIGPDEPITYELWRDRVHPEDRESAEAALTSALDPNGDGRYLAQFRVTNAHDGITRWIEVTGQATFEDGEPIRLIGTTRDITEQKQTEVILREDDRRKDEFIATLAHELRNPLAAIRIGLGVLESASGNPEQQSQMHAIIDRQSAQLVRLIDDLLDVSRITRGKVTLQKERIEIDRLFEHAVEATRETFDAKGVHLTVSSPEPIVIEADTLRFTQVLTNLLRNACKFTDFGGTVTLSAGRTGDKAVVRVRDTGVGIPPEQLSHIFEMFAQVDASRSEGGLGIGLSLARLIVDLHGGSIEARSEGPGTGSEFVIRVPVAAAVPSEQPSAREEVDAVLSSGAEPRRILVVDDNADALAALAVMLREGGHVVETAEDGESGLAKAQRMRPDVVLLDIGLPDTDGYQVARRIRSQPWARDVQLVAITGWGRDSDKRRAAEAGFDAHLTKPPDPHGLARLLASTARDTEDSQTGA